MLSDMTWRKLPRDLLTNENFQWIESQLPKELACAPYMFYMAALRQADDDGIFDLEDGVIFSRLMKIGTVRDLIKIANFMQQRKIITRVNAESNKCLITEWDYPKQSKPRTMAERRQKVLDKIEEEKKHNKPVSNKFTLDDMDNASNEIVPIQQSEVVNVDFAANPAGSFFCSDVDKNGENVVKEKQTEREKDIQTDLHTNINKDLDIHKDTHTQATDFRALAESALQSVADDTAVAETTYTKISEQTATDSQSTITEAPDMYESESDEVYDSESQEGMKGPTVDLIQDFFVKNCYGYKPNAGRKPISEIVLRIIALSDEMNPPDIIASVMLNEFKKLSESPGYWQGTPLLPAYMKKPGIWAHLLQASGRILAGNTNTKLKFTEQAAIYEAEAEKDRAIVCDAFAAEYLKWGIDPKDPARVVKLQQAKKAELQ